jgi:CBS-domain-containing membrane protein
MAIEVKDVMGEVTVAVREDAGFADIIAAMKRYAVTAVTVVDGGLRPVGVVTMDDLLLKETDVTGRRLFESRKQRAEHLKAQAVTAAELMTSPALTVGPTTPVRDAARLMHQRKIKQLPVVDPGTGRLVGTLDQSDALRVFTRPEKELAADVRAVLPGTLSFRIDGGVVTVSGRVSQLAEGLALIEAVRRVEGVVDVMSELLHSEDGLLIVPPQP